MRAWILAGLLLLAGCENPVEPGDARVIRSKGVYPVDGGHAWYFEAGSYEAGLVRCVVDEATYDRYRGGDEYRCEWA